MDIFNMNKNDNKQIYPKLVVWFVEIVKCYLIFKKKGSLMLS